MYWGQKMILQSNRYTYRITWSEEDKEYVGLCVEFPSLSWLAESQEGALKGIRKIVEEVIEDMKENGESPPLPLSRRKFSGKFLVRIPPEIHRKLAIEAEEVGISLNRLVSAKLSR
jgi:predicted HicB family RNase H-like nuclease